MNGRRADLHIDLTGLRRPPLHVGFVSEPVLPSAQRSPPSALPAHMLRERRPPMAARVDSTNDLVHRAGLSFYPPTPMVEEQAYMRPPPAKNLLLFNSRYKPFYLIGLGALGNVLYGTGTVAIERGVFARRPLATPSGAEKTLPPIYQPLFGQRRYSIGIGTTSAVAGALLALLSCALGFADARRLARKLNPARPNYARPNAYAAAHVMGIALSIGYKFMVDALRDSVSRDYTWAAAVPGVLGQALFAVTQAQAFSSCELQNGKMPLRRRNELGFAARAGMAFFILYGVMQGVPYLSSYGKEVVRLCAVTSATLAYSLPLTTARLQRTHAAAVPATERPKDSWYALGVLGLYMLGRIVAGFGPDLVQDGILRSTRGENGAQTNGYVVGGTLMVAVGTGICTVALMLYRSDVLVFSKKRANWLFAGAFAGLILIEVYRGLLEYSLGSRDERLAWVALVPGLVGSALRFAILPNLFSYAELYRGDSPVPHRYELTEGCRAGAQLLFGVWGSMCAIPGISPFVREAVGVAAGALALLGTALPTTTSRRALPQYAWPLSPGASPGAVPGTPRSAASA